MQVREGVFTFHGVAGKLKRKLLSTPSAGRFSVSRTHTKASVG